MIINQEFVSLILRVSVAKEDVVQGYFLINHDVQGFEESTAGELIIHLFKEEWNTHAEQQLSDFLSTLPKGEAEFVEMRMYQNTDWNAEWEAGIEPLRITDELVIAPSWKLLEAEEMKPKYLIVIDPKMSFGTGHHETTRLCLKMIEHIDTEGKDVLDLGSGTGILAMYAVMRGAKKTVAVDTDEWAFNNARDNCERNNLGMSIDVRLGDIHSVVQPDEMFDVLIANIHRNILLGIENDVAHHQRSGGGLILSGILEWDADEIMEAYKAAGYTYKERLQENEWVSLRFERT